MLAKRSEVPSWKRNLVFLPVMVLAIGLSACASAPQVPTESIMAADAAIRQAEEARVADYASPELRSAREKITAARAMAEKATKEKDEKTMKRARSLADESRSDAELAIAKAQAAKADAVNKEMQRNNDTLQQELQRKNGN